jgi:hypothetical protein
MFSVLPFQLSFLVFVMVVFLTVLLPLTGLWVEVVHNRHHLHHRLQVLVVEEGHCFVTVALASAVPAMVELAMMVALVRRVQ